MLVNIRRDHFRPDESRSSRIIDLIKIQSGSVERKSDHEGGGVGLTSWPDNVAETLEEEPVQPSAASLDDGFQELDADQQDGDSDLSSTDESSSASSTEEQAVEDPDHHIPGPVWQNKKSKVVHRCGRVDGSTACGRLVT